MFDKNDAVMNIVYFIVKIALIVLAILEAICGIVLALIVHPIFCLIAFIAPIGCILLWLIFRLFVSFLVDVKLIRNKLYDCENRGLERYFTGYGQPIGGNYQENNARSKKEKELEIALNRYKSGVINQKTYEEQVKAIIYGEDKED